MSRIAPAVCALFLAIIIQQQVLAEWAANAPLAMLPQYIHKLRQYQSIAIDVGNRDGLVADNTAFHNALNRFSITHRFAIYAGDHDSGVARGIGAIRSAHPLPAAICRAWHDQESLIVALPIYALARPRC